MRLLGAAGGMMMDMLRRRSVERAHNSRRGRVKGPTHPEAETRPDRDLHPHAQLSVADGQQASTQGHTLVALACGSGVGDNGVRGAVTLADKVDSPHGSRPPFRLSQQTEPEPWRREKQYQQTYNVLSRHECPPKSLHASPFTATTARETSRSMATLEDMVVSKSVWEGGIKGYRGEWFEKMEVVYHLPW